MIELSQIQNTSKLKELRGQINTMADEINGNQMVVGQVLNPRVIISYRTGNNREVDVSLKLNQLFALCMPKSNSVYIAQVFGTIYGRATTDNNPDEVYIVKIIIPAVKLPNRTAEVSSFVTPGSLGFTGADINGYSDGYTVWNTGVQVKLTVSNSTGSTTSIITNTRSSSSSTDDIILDGQTLTVLQEPGPILMLAATHAPN